MSRRSTRGQVSRLVDTTKARMQCVDSLSSTHLTTTQICPRNMALHTHPGLRTTSTDPKQMATNTIARQIIPLPRRLTTQNSPRWVHTHRRATPTCANVAALSTRNPRQRTTTAHTAKPTTTQRIHRQVTRGARRWNPTVHTTKRTVCRDRATCLHRRTTDPPTAARLRRTSCPASTSTSKARRGNGVTCRNSLRRL